jgi:arylsulfatase A
MALTALLTALLACLAPADDQRRPPAGYSIPLVDLATQTNRQIIVDREPNQYLGHPTTTLLRDGKTILVVYPKGHGRGAIVYKRSTNGGMSWSERLSTPASWASSQEVPTLYRVADKAGKQRLLLFSGLYPIRMAVSEDEGTNWSDLKPIGNYGGIVALSSLVTLRNGDLLGLFHDDGRFLRKGAKAEKPPVFRVYQIRSTDGGLTWGQPEMIASHATAHLCEPGAVRSPDGKELAVLLRENSRKHNSFAIFSRDEGTTWSVPKELPGALTGDRHTAKYAPDGRLLVSFRDMARESPTKGDWVAWVGAYEDLGSGREGQYRVRLMKNHHKWDCAYPGVEVLSDGTFVLTTYGHWTPGEQPYVVSVRLTLPELDALARQTASKPGTLTTKSDTTPPNVVIIFADDLGYGDLGCYGAKGFETPHLDRMAREGLRFTDFYSAQAVCSASRAALLTGCYPNRVGILGALGTDSKVGLSDREKTIASLLRDKGYATAIFGKWHLGALPRFLPTRHGFDEYFGLPYSNDMWPRDPASKTVPYSTLPLLRGEEVVERNPDQSQLTLWYTERAVRFIEANQARPFFLYVPHSMPHVPLHVSAKFRGKSARGLYGDVIAELDWSVGEILAALKKHGLDGRTLVVFASDNGPWLSYGNHGGSAGPLREGKGTTWEGGVRVPCVVRWPGRLPAGAVCREPAMTIDLLPTIVNFTGAAMPTNQIDGKDLGPLLTGRPGVKSPHEALYFYWDRHLQALRSGKWKLHFPHSYRTLAGKPGGADGKPAAYSQGSTPLSLYDLESDPGETTDVAGRHPEVVKALEKLAETAREDLGDSAAGRRGTGVRPPGKADN